MDISNQIKKFRQRDGYSQEFLAEKMFVSRQTISNWENNKSYPDIHNLLMMCNLFNVSLDDLVKGDVEKLELTRDKKELNFWTWMMIIPFLTSAILIGPLIHYLSWWGLGIDYIIILIGIFASNKVERIKIKNDIETYDRIVAFMNGKAPNEIKTMKLRDVFTSFMSLISFVGVLVLIGYLSILLTDKFL